MGQNSYHGKGLRHSIRYIYPIIAHFSRGTLCFNYRYRKDIPTGWKTRPARFFSLVGSGAVSSRERQALDGRKVQHIHEKHMTITHGTASCLVARTKASLNHHDQINFLSWMVNTKFSRNPSTSFGAETFKRTRTPSHYTFVIFSFYKGTEKRDAVTQPKPYCTGAAILSFGSVCDRFHGSIL